LDAPISSVGFGVGVSSESSLGFGVGVSVTISCVLDGSSSVGLFGKNGKSCAGKGSEGVLVGFKLKSMETTDEEWIATGFWLHPFVHTTGGETGAVVLALDVSRGVEGGAAVIEAPVRGTIAAYSSGNSAVVEVPVVLGLTGGSITTVTFFL